MPEISIKGAVGVSVIFIKGAVGCQKYLLTLYPILFYIDTRFSTFYSLSARLVPSSEGPRGPFSLVLLDAPVTLMTISLL